MHFKTSSERKQSPNKLFQGDTLSTNKVKQINMFLSIISIFEESTIVFKNLFGDVPN